MSVLFSHGPLRPRAARSALACETPRAAGDSGRPPSARARPVTYSSRRFAASPSALRLRTNFAQGGGFFLNRSALWFMVHARLVASTASGGSTVLPGQNPGRAMRVTMQRLSVLRCSPGRALGRLQGGAVNLESRRRRVRQVVPATHCLLLSKRAASDAAAKAGASPPCQYQPNLNASGQQPTSATSNVTFPPECWLRVAATGLSALQLCSSIGAASGEFSFGTELA